jgi:hypothetical protein
VYFVEKIPTINTAKTFLQPLTHILLENKSLFQLSGILGEVLKMSCKGGQQGY